MVLGIQALTCDTLVEFPFTQELRKLVVVNPHQSRKIYGPLRVNDKSGQLQISNSTDGAQFLIKVYNTKMHYDTRVFIHLTLIDVKHELVGELTVQNQNTYTTLSSNTSNPVIDFYYHPERRDSGMPNKRLTACDPNMFLCTSLWKGPQYTKSCVEALKSEDSFQIERYNAVDMKNDFLCGSAADYTMSMRHPKDCVGFDTFRWYSDNGEVSALDRITDWRQSKTEHTHITRERASLLNPPSGSSNVVCCIQTLITSLIMLRIISL